MYEYQDENLHISQLYVDLIIEPEFHSQKVTEILGIEPSKVCIKGETKISQYSKKMAPNHMWLLSTEGKVESNEPRRHIDWIMTQLKGKEKAFQELDKLGVKSYVRCCCFMGNANVGLHLSPKQMRELLKYNLEVYWDTFW